MSKFGKCFVIHGSHPLLRTFPMPRFSQCVAHINRIGIRRELLPAANLLEIRRNKTADTGVDIDQEASEKL